ncbi:putative O-linked N-acetylglucosamine transferase (SPINDLY family) [Delftia sp. 60]|uniref:O-linked N-acetylglucosamine transferase, SPINDLY family protein n=1 Tax=Delftia sp. 60 TaxID=2035216 RepID=UPI000C17904A|nr:glycosyltransferase [Delftia sp. 60]PIF34909.1 putative O-linked N-acetylglucosamine transferase (SPINDLY family) [Burkholderiales bacterium 23]PIF64308.1 putative O-linked N-acetylglucosamine transferase (SPINDLY family) [Delftia sp. 60]
MPSSPLANAFAAAAQPPSIDSELTRIRAMVDRAQFLEALSDLAQLVARDPRNSKVWLHIGFVYVRMSIWPQAMEALQMALEIEPRMPNAQRLLALALFSTGRRQEACDLIDDACRHAKNENTHWMTRAYIHSHTSSDPLKSLEVARDWGRRFADPLTRNAKPFPPRDRNPRKKLKVGYVTADFRQHSVAFFMRPVLEHHNPDNVEIHVYSSGRPDKMTEKLRALVPHWHDAVEQTDDQLYEQIRADGIDVLVDLSGFTLGHRLEVFARRAAPVQVTWLGYMHTLGMKAMDYRLVDAGIAPPNHAPYYSENLFQLACMASYAPPEYSPICEEPPMLRNGYPTLISLNNSAKITDEMLAVWARILHERQDARLIIMVKEQDPDAAQAHMQPRVEAAGMPLDRVSVLHQQPLDGFMELGHIADVALDTSPISGGTTTLHALWMGLPIVALDAERAVDASTARTLQGLGFGGEIASDINEYIKAALHLMGDAERLRIMRLSVRSNLERSVLMDYASRTTDLEKAYRLMWINWLSSDLKNLSITMDLESAFAETGAVA